MEASEMTPADEELLLRHALADLTSDQPPASAGRYTAIRSRAADRRRHQIVTAAVAVLTAAVLVFGLVQLPRILRTAPTDRSAAWALQWPDHRNGSVPQSVLNWAVRTWRFPNQWVLPPSVMSSLKDKFPPVIWYVGQTVASGHVVVVLFEADHRLVAGWAEASLVMGGTAGCIPSNSYSTIVPCQADPWTLISVPAPRNGIPGLAIGLNVHDGLIAAPSPSTLNLLFERRMDPDNWIVILTSPDVRRVTWRTSTAFGTVAGATSASSGLAIANTGHVSAPVELTGLFTSAGNLLVKPRYVGIPGNGAGIPELALPPPIPARGAHLYVVGSGQGSELDQAPVLQSGYACQLLPESGRNAAGVPDVTWHLPCPGPVSNPPEELVGSCYGPASLQVAGGGHLLGVVPCDNKPHQLSGFRPQDGIRVTTSMLTRWQLYVMFK
jgi:hypothetical protein